MSQTRPLSDCSQLLDELEQAALSTCELDHLRRLTLSIVLRLRQLRRGRRADLTGVVLAGADTDAALADVTPSVR